MAVASDIEGTLTTAETWKALARYLREHGQAQDYQRFFLPRLPSALAARAGLISRRSFQSQWIKDLLRFFVGVSLTDFHAVAEWVVEHELWPKRRQDVIASLLVHRSAGEKLIVATGTYQPIAEAFAKRLGAEALGTPLELSGGKLTGHILSEVNVANYKAETLHEALGSERLYAAYGDSEADIPMLMLGDRPVAVYPDKALRTTALTLGWKILDGSSVYSVNQQMIMQK